MRYEDPGKEATIWSLYGLKSNPFSIVPILVRGGDLKPNCFVGRKEELLKLSRQFRSTGGSRTLVTGEVGVGKTSFVNVARYKAIDDGTHFSPLQEIAVQENWEPVDFVMNTFYAIYSTLVSESSESLLKKDTYKQLETLAGVSILSGTGFSINILGNGVGVSSGRSEQVHLTFLALKDLFTKIINELHEKTGKETILHYNNLERIKENKVRSLFEDLRDFMETPHVHFVFVGNHIVGGIINGLPRVSSILSENIQIKKLTLTEVKEVIDLRLKYLAIEGLNTTRPYEESALKILYELYDGNIRDILNSLGTAVISITTNMPVRLNANETATILKRLAEDRLKAASLQPKAKEIVKEMVKHEEITNKGLADATNTRRPNISGYLRDLYEAGFILVKRKNGKDKYWAVEPRLKWLLLEESNPKKTGETLLGRF